MFAIATRQFIFCLSLFLHMVASCRILEKVTVTIIVWKLCSNSFVTHQRWVTKFNKIVINHIMSWITSCAVAKSISYHYNMIIVKNFPCNFLLNSCNLFSHIFVLRLCFLIHDLTCKENLTHTTTGFVSSRITKKSCKYLEQLKYVIVVSFFILCNHVFVI